MSIFDRLKNLKKSKEEEKARPQVQAGQKTLTPEGKRPPEHSDETSPAGRAVAIEAKNVTSIQEKRSSKPQTLTQTMLAAKTLLRPHITEKASLLQAQHQVVFDVPLTANKTQIKQAIKIIYGVSPKRVQITRLPRKTVWFGRTGGQTRLRKKAIAVFDRDQNIEAFSHV